MFSAMKAPQAPPQKKREPGGRNSEEIPSEFRLGGFFRQISGRILAKFRQFSVSFPSEFSWVKKFRQNSVWEGFFVSFPSVFRQFSVWEGFFVSFPSVFRQFSVWEGFFVRFPAEFLAEVALCGLDCCEPLHHYSLGVSG